MALLRGMCRLPVVPYIRQLPNFGAISLNVFDSLCRQNSRCETSNLTTGLVGLLMSSATATTCECRHGRGLSTRSTHFNKETKHDAGRPASNESNVNSSVGIAVSEVEEEIEYAHELIDDAKQTHGTVYFERDLSDAEVAVARSVSDYNKLYGSLSKEEKIMFLSTTGRKMEQLIHCKQELEEKIKHSHH